MIEAQSWTWSTKIRSTKLDTSDKVGATIDIASVPSSFSRAIRVSQYFVQIGFSCSILLSS